MVPSFPALPLLVILAGSSTTTHASPQMLALAQDWYVDVIAPGCPGTGTQADPFCQITDAVSAAVDGDTIHIAPGTYFENIVIDEDLTLIGTGGQQVTILDGSASGSVVLVQDSIVTLTGLTLSNGTGTLSSYLGWSSGGGLSAYSTVSGDALPRVTLTNCTVSGNSADLGGGLGSFYEPSSSDDSSIELVDSSVVGNMAVDGGGVSFADVTMVGCTVSGNAAEGSGGGISAVESHLTNSTVSYNLAGTASFSSGGGGIIGWRTVLISSSVTGNTVLSSNFGIGGGVYIAGCVIPCPTRYLELSNSIVAANYAQSIGGISFAGSGDVTIANSTITGNTDASYSYYSGGVTLAHGANLSVTNSVLSANGYVSLQVDASSSASVDHSLVEGGWPGTGNIDANPLFVDSVGGDYSLRPGSPCIDAGSNAAVPPGIVTDLEGKPRFLDDLLTPDTGVGPAPVVDMGAHEYGHAHRRARRR